MNAFPEDFTGRYTKEEKVNYWTENLRKAIYDEIKTYPFYRFYWFEGYIFAYDKKIAQRIIRELCDKKFRATLICDSRGRADYIKVKPKIEQHA